MQDALTKEGKSSSSIHGSFDEFQLVHMSLSRSILMDQVKLVLTRLWKIEEEKCLTKSEYISRKHPATESEKNLRNYFIAPTDVLI
jgi:hypothetical protein